MLLIHLAPPDSHSETRYLWTGKSVNAGEKVHQCFQLLYFLAILRHARRRLVSISVTNNPTAEWIAGQVTDAFPWDETPRHLIRDRDGAFGPARAFLVARSERPVLPWRPPYRW
ncbi:MAG TPA: hypothetical protein VJW93_02705 [Candidatus Acidoferrales bacterium]|nr:hypothetical protein [Candidatus Acidoferrales bacterium]